ncbi:MAG: DivIVA domain-containing protein [Firmicutes bacterium]|nr:DivIVA domain-containing protein [Bacillota bacterium]
MPLTPLDVHNKEFSRVFRGYDEAQVDEFLDRIVIDLEALLRENAELKDKVSRLSEMQDAIQRALLVAQEAADELRAEAEKARDETIQEARRQAGEILKEAEAQAEEARADQRAWQRRTLEFLQRLRELYQSQLDAIDQAPVVLAGVASSDSQAVGQGRIRPLAGGYYRGGPGSSGVPKGFEGEGMGEPLHRSGLGNDAGDAGGGDEHVNDPARDDEGEGQEESP